MEFVMLNDFIDEIKIEELYLADNINNVKIFNNEISRPGLQMAGYYQKFVPDRVQIIGNAEWHYLKDMTGEMRYDVLQKFYSYPIPLVVVASNLEIFPEMLELSKIHNVSLLRGNSETSKLINDLRTALSLKLAPQTSMHGVMLEVFGIGVLIIGKSGVGKSETALELITKGCRLIADDLVDIQRVEDVLRGYCPELIRYFLEIRGVGILDIERIYGVGAVKEFDYLDLVIELEEWDDKKEYDRMGLDEEKIEILGVNLPKITIPVKPGRNIALIVEVAAKNNRQKRLGYNAAEVLNERVKQSIQARETSSKEHS